jgi:hypothetical protein
MDRDEIIEYVEHLTATPKVLKMMIEEMYGSEVVQRALLPTINNLALSLDLLLKRLRNEDEK